MQQGQANLLRQRRGQAYQEAGLPMSTVDLPETVQSQIAKSKITTKSSPFETKKQQLAAQEYSQIPEFINTNENTVKDLEKMLDLTRRSVWIAPGILNPAISNQYKALQSKVALNRAQLMKGAQSDKDLALMMSEIGNVGGKGTERILQRSIEKAKGNIKFYNERQNKIANEYGLSQQTQPITSYEEPIFKGTNSATFSRPDGQTKTVNKANQQDLMAAVGQGFSPEGYTPMLTSDGELALIRNDFVQQKVDDGYTPIYAQ
jgi:hypothetical protein